jgi:partner of Y14 and mago protein
LSPEIINAAKAKKEKADRVASKSNPVPGLVIVSTLEGKSSKKKKKKKNGTIENELIESLSKTQLSSESKTQNSKSKSQSNSQHKTEAAKAKSQSKAAASNSGTQRPTETTVTLPTDPAKRIKNLRKRLREIESIEQKIAAGDQKLEKEQLDKVARKKEVMSEIEQWTLAMGGE